MGPEGVGGGTGSRLAAPGGSAAHGTLMRGEGMLPNVNMRPVA